MTPDGRIEEAELIALERHVRGIGFNERSTLERLVAIARETNHVQPIMPIPSVGLTGIRQARRLRLARLRWRQIELARSGPGLVSAVAGAAI